MARRNLLHRSRIEAFVAYLGDRALPPIGPYEVVRWKGRKGEPMRIVFDNSKSCEHLSINEAGIVDVMRFLNHRLPFEPLPNVKQKDIF